MTAPGLAAEPCSGPNSPDAGLVEWPFMGPNTLGPRLAAWLCIGTSTPDTGVPALELDLGPMALGLGSHPTGGRR